MSKLSRRPTLRDVAKAAKVSEMTVSRVLRNKGVVSAKTRRHVINVVDQLGYVPNRLAGSLATARSNQVAVIIPSLHNTVFTEVMSGITSELEKAKYNGVVGISDYSLAKEEDLVISMMSWRPAAVIVVNLAHSERTRNILANANVPVIEIMDTSSSPIDMSVGLDHAKAGRAIVDYMLCKGYRRFGYLGWLSNVFPAARRFAAIEQRLSDLGLDLEAPEFFSEPPDFAAGKDGLRRLLDSRPDLDAVIFSNDTAATGGIIHCIESGIDVPDRLAIAGFSGLQIGQTLPMKLTTVQTRRFDIGRFAARKILNALAGQRLNPVMDLGFELIEGETAWASNARRTPALQAEVSRDLPERAAMRYRQQYERWQRNDPPLRICSLSFLAIAFRAFAALPFDRTRNRSAHHSQTLPLMLNNPMGFGSNEQTGAVP